jgi:inorganic pyrophosphatase
VPKKRQRSLADPSLLSPRDEDDKQLLKVVVEMPKGSRNKYAFNRVFELKKVLPAGMAFPYDFGFLPSTKGGDGDPLDVLVLMDEPAFPGCVLKCRVIGVIEGEQGNKKKKERNDRLVAIEQQNHSWADIKQIRELEEFFINYHDLSDEKFRVIAVKGPNAARKLIKSGMK